MGAQPRGDAREQDAGRVRGNGPVTRPADLGGDVLKERDGLLVVGHEGSPETDVQQIHARQGRRFALGKVKDILEGSAEPVGQPDGIPQIVRGDGNAEILFQPRGELGVLGAPVVLGVPVLNLRKLEQIGLLDLI